MVGKEKERMVRMSKGRCKEKKRRNGRQDARGIKEKRLGKGFRRKIRWSAG